MSCSQFFKYKEAQRLDKAPCINSIRMIFASWFFFFFFISANHISKERDNNAVWPRLFSFVCNNRPIYHSGWSLFSSWFISGLGARWLREHSCSLWLYQFAAFAVVVISRGAIGEGERGEGTWRKSCEEKWERRLLKRSRCVALLPYSMYWHADVRLHDKTDYYFHLQTIANPHGNYEDCLVTAYGVNLPDWLCLCQGRCHGWQAPWIFSHWTHLWTKWRKMVLDEEVHTFYWYWVNRYFSLILVFIFCQSYFWRENNPVQPRLSLLFEIIDQSTMFQKITDLLASISGLGAHWLLVESLAPCLWQLASFAVVAIAREKGVRGKGARRRRKNVLRGEARTQD